MVGKTVAWLTCGMAISCRVIDARCVFNRVDYLITPLQGTGRKWVSQDACNPIALTKAVTLTDAELDDPAFRPVPIGWDKIEGGAS